MITFCFNINIRVLEAQPQTSSPLKYSPLEYLLHTSKQTNIATDLMQHHRIKHLVLDSGSPIFLQIPSSRTLFSIMLSFKHPSVTSSRLRR